MVIFQDFMESSSDVVDTLIDTQENRAFFLFISNYKTKTLDAWLLNSNRGLSQMLKHHHKHIWTPDHAPRGQSLWTPPAVRRDFKAMPMATTTSFSNLDFHKCLNTLSPSFRAVLLQNNLCQNNTQTQIITFYYRKASKNTPKHTRTSMKSHTHKHAWTHTD